MACSMFACSALSRRDPVAMPVLCADESRRARRGDHRGLVRASGSRRAQHSRASGAAVVLGARRADRLDDAAAQIRAAGGRAESVVDGRHAESDVARLVARARERVRRASTS